MCDCQVHPLLCVLCDTGQRAQKGLTDVVESKLAYTLGMDLHAGGFPVSFSYLIKIHK